MSRTAAAGGPLAPVLQANPKGELYSSSGHLRSQDKRGLDWGSHTLREGARELSHHHLYTSMVQQLSREQVPAL